MNRSPQPQWESVVERVRAYAQESLAYLAKAYVAQSQAGNEASDATVQQMYPYAHVLALTESDVEIRSLLAIRRSIVEWVVKQAEAGEIDWPPLGEASWLL